MRYRGNRNDDLDALTETDRAKIRSAARASVPVGLEGLAHRMAEGEGRGLIRSTDPLPGKPVGQPVPPPSKPRKGKRA